MYLERLKLNDRVAVVTGGGQGIGFACAQALAEAGARVVVAEMMPERVESSVAALKKLGLKASGVTLDVTKSKDVDKAAAAVIAAERQRAIAFRNRDTASALEEYARARLEAGQGSRLNHVRSSQELAGAEGLIQVAELAVRQAQEALGIAVFSGMLGVTVFGIFLTPVFYYVVVRLFGSSPPAAPDNPMQTTPISMPASATEDVVIARAASGG